MEINHRADDLQTGWVGWGRASAVQTQEDLPVGKFSLVAKGGLTLSHSHMPLWYPFL